MPVRARGDLHCVRRRHNRTQTQATAQMFVFLGNATPTHSTLTKESSPHALQTHGGALFASWPQKRPACARGAPCLHAGRLGVRLRCRQLRITCAKMTKKKQSCIVEDELATRILVKQCTIYLKKKKILARSLIRSHRDTSYAKTSACPARWWRCSGSKIFLILAVGRIRPNGFDHVKV